MSRPRFTDMTSLQARFGGKRTVREAEDLLSGHAVTWYRDRHLGVPMWAMLNALAHANPEEIRLVAGGAGDTVIGWSPSCQRVARRLVRLERAGFPIGRVQRDVLVPVELEMLVGGTGRADHPACGLVEAVERALDRYFIDH